MFFKRFSFHLLLASLVCTPVALANEPEYEDAYEEPYQEETYQEEVYQEESYQEETYEDSYVEEPYQQAEPAYSEPAYEAPPMDSDQAAMVKEARTNCQQWAQESGLEGEDKTLFIEDCVYSQTGF